MTQEKTESLKEKLIKSDAVNSIKHESEIYKTFLNLGFSVMHSPYFIDEKTGKLREVDISARKFWAKETDDSNSSTSISFIVECKSISNYHIIATNNNSFECGLNLESTWVGDGWINNYSKIVDTLKKYSISEEDIVYILQELNKYCFPNGMIRHLDDKLNAFRIPTYNSFRETNIGNTKEVENSVVWKAYQSLYSCIKSYDTLNWQNFESELDDNMSGQFLRHKSEFDKDHVLEILINQASHIEYIHPVLVVESNLWELNNDSLAEKKYIRLVFQELFGEETWIDVVSLDHLDEYIQSSKEYDFYLNETGFKNETIANKT